jgi:formamidopyrimidine-DNA glycosylase
LQIKVPELPEVQTVVSELNRKLKNKTIKSVEVFRPKIISIGPKTVSNIRTADQPRVKKFISLLEGEKILSVKRRAKMLIFDLKGPLSMLVHLKMTGQFIFEDEKQHKKTHGKYRLLNKLTAPLVELPCKFTHVIFHFTDNSTLFYNDVRQFGYLKIVHDNEIGEVKELKEYGPEPLDKKFTYQVFIDALNKRPKAKIKQVLLDPKVVVGIGNIYSDEILFHAKVHPLRTISSLTEHELKAIYKYIPIVLKEGIKYKGSSVGDFIRTDGSTGTMGKHHYVYALKKHPCKHCATIIQSLKIGGRTTSFCPNCQK